MDNLLIEFWRQHDCLFNSSIESYYDKHLKTKLWSQFAQSIGKPVSDVERRSRSLRTQYGRLLWRPDRIKTFQQTMLKEKLDFLRPYIIRRRGGEEENFNDDDEEGEETEGSIDQETGSMFGSLLDADVSGADAVYEARSQNSTPSATPQLLCPPSQPQVTEAVINMASSGNVHPSDDNIAVHPPREERSTTEEAAAVPRQHHDVLNQFSEVMLSDMRQIRDPLVLMRLRRDITDLVFKAAEEDALLRQRGGRASLVSHDASAASGESGHQFRGYTRAQDAVCLQNYKMNASPSRRQRILERRNRGIGRRIQKWEMMRRVATRGQRPHPPPGGGGFQGQEDHHHHHHEQERLGDACSQPAGQALETKPEFEPQMVKIEEEMLPLV